MINLETGDGWGCIAGVGCEYGDGTGDGNGGGGRQS